MENRFSFRTFSVKNNKRICFLIIVVLVFPIVASSLKFAASSSDGFSLASDTFFSDGFESGSFSSWTGSRSTGTGLSQTVQSELTHHGTYAMQVGGLTQGADNGVCIFKDLSQDYSTVDARIYVQFTSLPTAGDVVELFGFTSDGWLGNARGTRIDAYNDAGTLKWRVIYDNNGFTGALAGSISLNTWYCVEVKLVIGNGFGETRLYIDGSEIFTATGLTNTDLGASVRYFSLGADDEHDGSTLSVYYDCLEISTSYIGPESSPEPTPTPTPTPTATPTPSPTPTPTPPNGTVVYTLHMTMTATIGQPEYIETNISKIIQTSWIASDGTLYAGAAATLYKSNDQGNTNWQPLITFNDSATSGIDCVFVNKYDFVFAATSPSVVPDELGLWRTTDGGQTWSHVLTLPSLCTIWSMDEDSNGVLYAGVYTTDLAYNARIYRSIDNGSSWSSVYYDSAARHVHDVAVDKSNNYVYASLGDSMGPWNTKYIIRSTNGGDTWTKILSDMPQIVAIQAIPGARLFGTDESVNGRIYRTTDDLTDTVVLDVGKHAYGFWFSVNPLNSKIYASFVYGERNLPTTPPTDNLAAIYTSDNNGLGWNTYRSFNVTKSYSGSYWGSNFVNGVMYYTVRLDSGYTYATKIYPSYPLGGASISDPNRIMPNLPPQTPQNGNETLNSNVDSQSDDYYQSSNNLASTLPLSIGVVAVSTIQSEGLLKSKSNRILRNLQAAWNPSYQIYGSNNNSSLTMGGENN